MGKTNFAWLLGALLIFLVGLPLAADLTDVSEPTIRGLAFTCLVVVGVWSLRGSGRWFHIGLAFVVAEVVFTALALQASSVALLYASFGALFGFLLVAISFTLKQVVMHPTIDRNRLIGTVCVYLLLGVIWAVAYAALELTVPGSFSGFAMQEGAGWDNEWIYFSFVTMTTLGYGDLLPLTPTARALAYMQAVFGQFYIAILVAGLVSAFISDRQTKSGIDD